MITLNISKEQIKRAKELYDFNNINNSFTKGESQIYGALGEIVFKDYYSISDSSHVGETDYDFIYKNKKIEVKTKRTSVQPRPYYLNSIPIYSLHQKCDEYVFIRILKDMSKAWICGWITKQEFFNKGFYGKEGDIDPSSKDGFTFKEDCLNVPINELKQVYAGQIDKNFLSQFFKLNREDLFYVTDYRTFKEIGGGDMTIRLVYHPENKKLTVQELNKGNLFNGFVKTQAQFVFLFEKLLTLTLS